MANEVLPQWRMRFYPFRIMNNRLQYYIIRTILFAERGFASVVVGKMWSNYTKHTKNAIKESKKSVRGGINESKIKKIGPTIRI